MWIKLLSRAAGDVRRRQRFSEGGSSFLFKCVMASLRPCNPVSHPHQIMHTNAPKKKRKKENIQMLCKMFISLWTILNNLFSVWRKERGPTLECTVQTSVSKLWQKTSVGSTRPPKTTWMPTRWDIISCKEYGTWYYLFIRPTEEPIAKDISQIEVMEHSLSIILYYTDSSAICVSLSLSEKHGTVDREMARTYCHMQ